MRQMTTHATTCWWPCWCLGMVSAQNLHQGRVLRGQLALYSAVTHCDRQGHYTGRVCGWFVSLQTALRLPQLQLELSSGEVVAQHTVQHAVVFRLQAFKVRQVFAEWSGLRMQCQMAAEKQSCSLLACPQISCGSTAAAAACPCACRPPQQPPLLPFICCSRPGVVGGGLLLLPDQVCVMPKLGVDISIRMCLIQLGVGAASGACEGYMTAAIRAH
jgi:hypothetical protein